MARAVGPATTRRTVVITGTSTGIGNACALLLRSKGYRVFAGVRNEADAEAKRTQDLIPLCLDITDSLSIKAAAAQVAEAVGEDGLYALVNNAGVVVPGPLEYLPVAKFREQLDVSLIGQLAVTQEFLPLLRKARGRIVNVSSVNGRLTSPLLGAYGAAKHGIEALSDALRLELRPWGIQVSVIQPGVIATSMSVRLVRDLEHMCADMPATGQQLYATTIRRYGRVLADNHRRSGSPPQVVATAVHTALTARRPRTRYAIGAQAGLLMAVVRALPDRLMDRLVLRFLGDKP